MSDVGEVIAFSIDSSRMMVDRFLEDLTPADYLHRPMPKANCAAWIVGHLILTDRRILARLGVNDLPAIPDGFEQRYARDEHAPFASDFGDVSVLRPLWKSHRDLLANTVRPLTVSVLNQPLDQPHPRFKTIGEMVQFMALHAALHAGHISLIRRTLGRPPLI